MHYFSSVMAASSSPASFSARLSAMGGETRRSSFGGPKVTVEELTKEGGYLDSWSLQPLVVQRMGRGRLGPAMAKRRKLVDHGYALFVVLDLFESRFSN